MRTVSGGCHCGNIRMQVQLTREPVDYRPRACDCDFCRKHQAAYLSDPEGSLHLQITDNSEASRYRQGSGQAQLLLCKRCGVLVAAIFEADGQWHGAANARAVDAAVSFGAQQSVSPQKLTATDKVRRWQEIWFHRVTLSP
jgi:hypothetical protein